MMVIPVPLDFLEKVADQNCCSTLNMHEPHKSRGKVIVWRGKTWACTGSAYKNGCTEADLREVLPEQDYRGPPNNPKVSGPGYYNGGRFTCRGKAWVMTRLEIRLIPATQSQPAQLSFF